MDRVELFYSTHVCRPVNRYVYRPRFDMQIRCLTVILAQIASAVMEDFMVMLERSLQLRRNAMVTSRWVYHEQFATSNYGITRLQAVPPQQPARTP